jgi:hypothetical protein
MGATAFGQSAGSSAAAPLITSSLTPVVYQGAAFVSARANADANLADLMLLSDGKRVDNGIVQWPAHGLTIGAYYFLSQTTAGAFTAVVPLSGLVQSLFFVESANTIHVSVERASAPSSGYTPPFDYGDYKASRRTADFNGWVLCDGRLKSALTPSQQLQATLLGMGANIDDGRDRVLMGASGTKPLGVAGGSNTIAQNNLPNAGLSVSGSTGNAGAHGHNINGNANGATGGSQGTFSTITASSWNVISSVGDHAHSISGSTSSINGGVAQQPYSPAFLAANLFIYLGA